MILIISNIPVGIDNDHFAFTEPFKTYEVTWLWYLSLTKRVGLRELSGQLSYILQKAELLTKMFPMSKTQTETRAIKYLNQRI